MLNFYECQSYAATQTWKSLNKRQRVVDSSKQLLKTIATKFLKLIQSENLCAPMILFFTYDREQGLKQLCE